ncbi:MAG TPA: CoA ester lyase [Stellaceae bacterium]|nr:CoA ester lyase [Stellaceae bacterium]
MSFTEIPERPARLQRSHLSVPAGETRFFEKAAAGAADIVMLDLEDSVAPDRKDAARKNAIAALHDVNWRGKTLSLRVNGLDTAWTYRDVVDVVEQAGDRLDLLMIPKVGVAADVYALDMLVTQIERAKGRRKRLGFELQIESALGLENVAAIAAASPRNEALHFGSGDFGASIEARVTNIGGAVPEYAMRTDKGEMHWGDPWHYALSRIVVAARANGLRPIDGPFADFHDPDGFRAAASRVAAMGIEGKWAIHPSQIALANEVFTPQAAEIDRAHRIVAALDEAQRQGRGAVTLDGRMIDAASIRQAQAVLKKAEASGRR